MGSDPATKCGCSPEEGYRYELAPLGIDSVIVQPGAYPTPVFGKKVTPDDAVRVAGYDSIADLVHQVLGGLEDFVASDQAGDPQVVADAISDLIEAPAGQRPLRSVVDQMGDGVQQINEVGARVQREALEGAGIQHLLDIPTG